MTYELLEASIESGAPVFLYEFRRGAAGVWRFTGDVAAVLSGGNSWEPRAVSHSAVALTGEVARDALRVTFPEGDAFAEAFLQESPSDEVTTVSVYRGHRGEDDFRVIWKGRVGKPAVNGASIELSCEPAWTSQKRIGLLTPYQRPCPHAVYYGKCRLNKDAFAISVQLLAVNKTAVTIAAPAVADGFLNGGFVESMSTGEMRMIRAQVAGALVLLRPLAVLSDDLASGYGNNYGNSYGTPMVKVYPGCDRSPTRCAQFLNPSNPSGTNIENYGGFLWIPTGGRNPFTGSSLV